MEISVQESLYSQGRGKSSESSGDFHNDLCSSAGSEIRKFNLSAGMAEEYRQFGTASVALLKARTWRLLRWLASSRERQFGSDGSYTIHLAFSFGLINDFKCDAPNASQMQMISTLCACHFLLSSRLLMGSMRVLISGVYYISHWKYGTRETLVRRSHPLVSLWRYVAQSSELLQRLLYYLYHEQGNGRLMMFNLFPFPIGSRKSSRTNLILRRRKRGGAYKADLTVTGRIDIYQRSGALNLH